MTLFFKGPVERALLEREGGYIRGNTVMKWSSKFQTKIQTFALLGKSKSLTLLSFALLTFALLLITNPGIHIMNLTLFFPNEAVAPRY